MPKTYLRIYNRQKTMQNLPEKFLEILQELFPSNTDFQNVLKTFQKRPTTFRVNLLKTNVEKVLEELKQNRIKAQKSSFSDIAFIVDSKFRKQLMDLEIYKNGHIYLQSLASQVPVLILDPKPGETVLDLTAAPGSKTSQIAALMQNQGRLIANEQNKPRFFKLMHNMQNLGVLNSDKSEDDFIKLYLDNGISLAYKLNQKFDRILLDTPCSAESRFVLSDASTYKYWHIKKVKTLVQTQKRLLKSAFHALKVGGTLVYSTCTINPHENEEQIEKFLAKNPNAKLEPINLPGLTFAPLFKTETDLSNTKRIMMDSNIESFYVAKITKTHEIEPSE